MELKNFRKFLIPAVAVGLIVNANINKGNRGSSASFGSYESAKRACQKKKTSILKNRWWLSLRKIKVKENEGFQFNYLYCGRRGWANVIELDELHFTCSLKDSYWSTKCSRLNGLSYADLNTGYFSHHDKYRYDKGSLYFREMDFRIDVKSNDSETKTLGAFYFPD